MRISSILMLLLVALGCLDGPEVQWSRAQNHPSPSQLLQMLQSEQTTDNARDELLKLGKSDPEVRQYLVVHLPPLIERGPSVANCPSNPCETWRNAVELAGHLKIGEAAPAVTRWITVKDVNPWPGIRPYGNKLEINPTVIALSRIGDPAIPALQHVVDSGGPDQHTLAVHALCRIQSPKAKAVLRGDLQHESDPDLQAMIKRVLEEKKVTR